MQELLKSFVVRPAEKLTPKQVDTLAIKSHPEHLQSVRFKKWQQLCREQKFQELESSLKAFVDSSEIINSIQKIPAKFKQAIEFAEYHGYNFNLPDFVKYLEANSDKENKTKGSKTEEKGVNIIDVYSNIADQMLAESIVKSTKPQKSYFNKQAILKTLHLITFLQSKKQEKLDFNVSRIYEKPILLPTEFYEIDWCSIKHSVPNENLKEQIDLLIKENALRVAQGRDGNTTSPILTDAQFVNLIITLGKKLGISPRGISIADLSTMPREKVNELNAEIIEYAKATKNLIEQNYPTPTKLNIDPCNCTCDETCVEQNPCCAKIVPYVADLYVVKEEVSRYEAGEMSYIENVIESEIRERVNRNFEREEVETQHEEEQTSFEQHDHQVDEKFSLQKEIEKQIEQSISVDAGVVAHQKWGTGDVTATTNFGFNQSKKDAQKTVQNNAKEVIDKSVSSLQKKVRDLTIRRVTKEIEETNKHTLGGQTGATKHMSQQFYYVNQIKRAQVFSWGKRQLIDLYLPEPSELYKRLIGKKFDRKKPELPKFQNIEIRPDIIIKDNYIEICKQYNICEIEGPQQEKIIQIDFSYSPNDRNLNTDQKSFTVEDGFVAYKMNITAQSGSRFDNGNADLDMTVVGSTLKVHSGSGSGISSISLPDVSGIQSVIVAYYNFEWVKASISINCKPNSLSILKWQLSIFNKIMEVYQKELDEYNTALAEFEKSKQAVYNQNPFILLQDIQEQLKQAAISYISCQFFDDMDAMKQNIQPCDFPQFDIRESHKEGEFVRFFEQAFEWKFMNFIFYPYFWSRKCTWEKKMNEQADNMLFQRFLKAGFVRLSIPVRQGFEGHVNWYLKTRQIWSNVGAPDSPGADFLPIIQEIKEDKENFNTDREGLIIVTDGQPDIKLTNSDYYWNIGNPTTTPIILPHVDQDRINADLNREINIDCITYKIINITQDTTDPTHKTWTITLDRPYKKINEDLPSPFTIAWSTGAVFIGAPWEFKVPTKLVWMRTPRPDDPVTGEPDITYNKLPKKYPIE